MVQQSLRQVFVTNIPALLPEGKTVESIAVGQVGILDAKSHKATTSPTYGKNKAIEVVWGTPDVPVQTINFGGPNQNEYSKLIKGKLLRDFRGEAASRGQNQIITVGNSGSVSDTDTLTAMPGDLKKMFLTLTGGAITKEFSVQGLQRQYFFKEPVASDCADDCVAVDSRAIAETMVKQINADKDVNKYVRASAIIVCDPELSAPSSVTVYKFKLVVPDTQDSTALGKVQAQYPDFDVKRTGIEGINSVYSATRSVSTLPAAFSQTNFLIPECDTCPAGYTLTPSGFAYLVVKEDAGNAAALNAVKTQYSIAGSESVSRIDYKYGQSSYIVVSDSELSTVAGANEVQSIVATGATAGTFTLTFDGETTSAIAYNATASAVQTALEGLSNINPGDITVAGGPLPTTAVTVTFNKKGDVPALVPGNGSMTGGNAVVTTSTPGVEDGGDISFLGEVRDMCVLTSPSSTVWTANGSVKKVAKKYRTTLADTICGEDRLADLQDAFPDNVVTLVDADGDCVHTYEITVHSQEIETGCSTDVATFIRPQKFEGAEWVEVPAAPLEEGTTCLSGIKLEVAVRNPVTNEYTFDSFPYDAELVYLEVSTGDQDYNSSVPLENEWAVKQIQSPEVPKGVGQYIQKLEKDSLSYSLKQRSSDTYTRQLEGYELQAKTGQFYDEYVLEFDFSYMTGGWAQRYTDSYSLFVYFPEGQGKAFEAAVNSYIASAGLPIDPVVI